MLKSKNCFSNSIPRSHVFKSYTVQYNGVDSGNTNVVDVSLGSMFISSITSGIHLLF